MITLLVFLLILTVLVLIHEAGHYFVAKKFGIKVEEFGFGIPPRAWGKKIGETLYSINWLPIGGFVKLFGEDDAGGGRIDQLSAKRKGQSADSPRSALRDNADLKRAFFAKSVWQRALVVVAGVVMNALLAFVIYYVFLFFSGFKTEVPLLAEYNFPFVHQQNKLDALIVTGIMASSPASKAGLKPCSKTYCLQLLSVNGQKPTGSDSFQSLVAKNAGKDTVFSMQEIVKRHPLTVHMTPRQNPPKHQGALGIRFDTQESAVLSYDTPAQKLFSGITHPINMMVYQFTILGKFIEASISQKSVEPVSGAFSGPVGIFVVTGEVLQIPDLKERLLAILNLAGLLSMSLAIFNVLPIPALDGGRLFFILVEGIFRKKISAEREAQVHSIGMAVLLGLILLITFKDIFQFFVK